jgi:membrane protease YdiL (CAAX protease family)
VKDGGWKMKDECGRTRNKSASGDAPPLTHPSSFILHPSQGGWLDPILAAFRGRQLKPTIVLLVSPLLLVTWRYYGSHEFLLDQCQSGRLSPRLLLWGDPQTTAAVYSFLTSFLLLGVVPALIVKIVFRQRLADYGVQLGDRRRTVGSFLLLAPLFILFAYVGSHRPAIRAYYPINQSAGASASMFGFHACTYLVFYMSREFYFRGFLQFGLRDSLGDVNAVLVQVLVSVLFHFGKPTAEIYGSILASLLWGILAFRNRSLLSGLLQHFLLGLSVDWFICFG